MSVPYDAMYSRSQTFTMLCLYTGNTLQVVAEKIEGITRNFLKLHGLGGDAVVFRSVTEESTNVPIASFKSA